MMSAGTSTPVPSGSGRLVSASEDSPDLAEKVRFLRHPESYGTPASSVEAIETHMAWVFLVGSHAYKIKKPVLRDMLDYRSLEDRFRVCSDEVRLNRRLAPDVYLGVVPLTWSKERGLSLAGGGVVVDWLVHMRRLPRSHMLDRMAAEGSLRVEDVEAAARLLAEFYRSASPVPFAPEEYGDSFHRGVAETAGALRDPAFGLSRPLVTHAADALSGFLTGSSARLLDERAREGRIIEAHGDLRPEHILMGPEPAVIDCLEFDRRLRLLDPADELSFFAVECSLLGQRWVGERFRHIYSELTGDRPKEPLLGFYEAYRAFVRAKIAIWHLADDGVRDHGHWRARAVRYLEFALRALDGVGR
jgi:aminoglycoside phosphotransferase family enzyme